MLLAFKLGLWKMNCFKQKWKNNSEDLQKECVVWATGFFLLCVTMWRQKGMKCGLKIKRRLSALLFWGMPEDTGSRRYSWPLGTSHPPPFRRSLQTDVVLTAKGFCAPEGWQPSGWTVCDCVWVHTIFSRKKMICCGRSSLNGLNASESLLGNGALSEGELTETQLDHEMFWFF